MARWNNGYVGYGRGFITSTKSLPQDGGNDPAAQVLSSETRKQIQLQEIRRTRGRFTADYRAVYDFGGPSVPKPLDRGDASLPFIEGRGIRLADGGDLRDTNALGGGMPPGVSKIGGGMPVRQSPFHRSLAKRLDNPSPVKRGI